MALAGIAYAFYRWRKNREQDAESRLDNEKDPFSDHAAVAGSMNPITVPPPAVQARENIPMAAAAGPATALGATIGQPGMSHGDPQQNGSANPFGPQAEIPPNNADVPPALKAGLPAAGAEKIAAAAGAGVAAGAAAGVAAKAMADRKGEPNPLAIQPPPVIPAAVTPAMPSPAGTEFSDISVSSAAAVAVAASANGMAPPVHRVQLDFVPSLADELPLKAGELVRLLHEYDDGWVRSPNQPLPLFV
jgi:hypothetical protein